MKTYLSRQVMRLFSNNKKKVFGELQKNGRLSILNIAKNLKMPHSTVTLQLRRLDDLGYVSSQKIGKNKFYSISEKHRYFSKENSFKNDWNNLHKRIAESVGQTGEVLWLHFSNVNYQNDFLNFNDKLLNLYSEIKKDKSIVIKFITTNERLHKIISIFRGKILEKRKGRKVVVSCVESNVLPIEKDLIFFNSQIYIINFKEKMIKRVDDVDLAKITELYIASVTQNKFENLSTFLV